MLWHVQNYILIRPSLFSSEHHVFLWDLHHELINTLWNDSQATNLEGDLTTCHHHVSLAHNAVHTASHFLGYTFCLPEIWALKTWWISWWKMLVNEMNPGPHFSVMVSYYPYQKSHCKDNRIIRWSYLPKWISITSKMESVSLWFPEQSLRLL